MGSLTSRAHSCGRLPERAFRAVFHWLVIKGCRLLFTLTCRVRVVILAPVPKHGALIMASNHISHFDPHLLGMASPRRIDWMASDILFRHPLSAFYFRNVGTIFVRQYQADHGALREAVRRARQGQCIGIFAEGGIRECAPGGEFLSSPSTPATRKFLEKILKY